MIVTPKKYFVSLLRNVWFSFPMGVRPSWKQKKHWLREHHPCCTAPPIIPSTATSPPENAQGGGEISRK